MRKSAWLSLLIAVLVLTPIESLLLTLLKPNFATAAAGDGRMLLFWDGGAAPSGWTCVSCNPGDPFYQLFPRGNDTYGGTGGALNHTHTTTNSIDPTADAATTESRSGNTVSDNGHSHTVSVTIGAASNLPSYRNLQIIRSDTNDEPSTIPTGAIALFDSASLPSGWTAYSVQNGFFPRGESTAGGTGGNNTHSNPLSIIIGAAAGAEQGPRTNGSLALTALAGHTHTASGNSDPVNHEPPYIEVIFAQATATAVPPDGILAMWDDDQPANWTKQSASSGAFYERFLKGSSGYGLTGGSTSHIHPDTDITTSTPIGTGIFRNGSAGASDTHTHNVNVDNYSDETHLPPYRDVIIAKRVPQSDVELSGYRLFKNNNGTAVGDPLAALNTGASTPRQGKPFRLRLLLHVSTADLNIGNKNFKLQYAQRSGTCDTSFSGESYMDVDTASGAIQYFNNSTPADGDALTVSANDPTHSSDGIIAQTYEESNNFTNTSAIAINEDGLWDFSLVDFSAVASTSFCFRVVFADNTLLDSYSVIPEITTDDGNGHVLLMWDGASVPSGWSCVSCAPEDDFYQRFFRGADTYGATGGSVSHGHTGNTAVSVAIGLTVEEQAGTGASTAGHTHPAFSATINDANHLPPYRQLKIIRYDTSGVPATLPAGVIAMFDAAVPVGWTRYAIQDGQYIRGENTVGSTGGSLTHTHAITGTIGASSGETGAPTNGSKVISAVVGHTHTVNGVSTATNHEPPYRETVLGQLNSTSAVPLDIITLWDGPIPGSWTNLSSIGQPFDNRFVKPATTYGTAGGSATHTHADSVVASDATAPVFTDLRRSGTINAGGAHYHDVTVSNFSTTNNLPPYVNVIIAKLGVANIPPNAPTTLDQKRTNDLSSISVGAYANSGQVTFTAQASDTNNPDDLQLCVEVISIASSFTNSPTQCGSLTSYSGSPINVSVNVSGLLDGVSYHWQVQIKDGSGGTSAWVSFGGNLETEADFIIDSTSPTGSVFDGTTIGIDIDYNDGALDSLSANWNFSDSGSGLDFYEYAIGTTIGGTDVLNWTNASLSTSVTVNSLNLSTSQVYYFSVRAIDNAGNDTTLSSDGQIVAPTLSFSVSGGDVIFDNLNSGNSYTDTVTTTLTTSTNARNGYEVRAYLTNLLETAIGQTIPLFNGGTYAAPDAWLGGDTGHGYTTDDILVQGVNKFNPPTCAGGGIGPCFAPFSLTAPGDIIADNQSIITGTPIANENFIITHRVTASPDQPAGSYQTVLILNATAIY